MPGQGAYNYTYTNIYGGNAQQEVNRASGENPANVFNKYLNMVDEEGGNDANDNKYQSKRLESIRTLSIENFSVNAGGVSLPGPTDEDNMAMSSG